MKKPGPWILIAAVFILPITVFAIVKWYQNDHSRLPVLGPEGHTVSDYSLVNERGQTASQADWQGRVVVANFFFTHCPVICPKMMHNLATVQGAYSNDGRILFTSFSVDPERDSAAQLHRYATRMNIHGNWQLLTGDKKEIYRVARSGFLVTATEGDGGPGDFIHSEKLVLVDRQKRIRGYYNGTDAAETQRLLRDIARLKKEQAD